MGKKFVELPVATGANDADLMLIEQGGTTKQVTKATALLQQTAAINSKADALSPATAITATGNLTRAAHANRMTPVTTGGTTQTLNNDATGGWTSDDSLEIVNDNSGVTTLAAGSSTLRVPVGYKASAGQYQVLTALHAKGNEFWSTTPDMENFDGGSPSAGLQTFKVRRGTAAQWTAPNTVLADGQIGWETDTKKLKVGDGSTAWNSLAYFAPGSGLTTFQGGAVTIPLDTATNTLLTQAIPGGTLGPNGWVEADILVSRAAAGVGVCTFQLFMGTQQFGINTTMAAANLHYHATRRIDNKGAQNVQKFNPVFASYQLEGGGATAMGSGAIDTSASWNFIIKSFNASTETQVLTLEKWSLKCFYGA